VALNLRNRSLLKELDFAPDELRFLLRLSAELKAAKVGGYELGAVHHGRRRAPARHPGVPRPARPHDRTAAGWHRGGEDRPSPTVAVAAFVAACWAAGLVMVVVRRLAARRTPRAGPERMRESTQDRHAPYSGMHGAP